MSDNVAAAVLASAALAKMALPPGSDPGREIIKLYRRMRNVVKRVDGEQKGGVEAEDEPGPSD